MARHPHYDLLKEWIEDIREVQFKVPSSGEWVDWNASNFPRFNPDMEWRFKPIEEDTWTPCKSGKLRFVKRQIVKDINLTSVSSIGQLQQMYTTSILQQLMVNQKAEYKWMDVPVEEEDNG